MVVAFAAPLPAEEKPVTAATDVEASLPGLPAIGKWMIDRNGAVAHWLGEHYDGKRLYEPINVILIDEGATSADDARTRLLAATKAAGYAVRLGHSTGYRGLIGGELYEQLPQGRDEAFSNHIFEETNNHGRVFGPHRIGDAYLFIAAFSRERVKILAWPEHRYGSFNQARDDLARHLAEKTAFKPHGHVPLGNAIVGDSQITTADHDGRAVVLRAAR
jgi:hypothetical protein